ncbi:Uncharacterised protein [Phocaeicola vulgatus]|nr:Uncharacterised protein [Phocaeicola vulgatus]
MFLIISEIYLFLFRTHVNYRMGGEMFSKVAPSKNWWYVKESCRLFVAKVSWNISFGRKYETMQKRVNNEDSNAGTLKSGK